MVLYINTKTRHKR